MLSIIKYCKQIPCHMGPAGSESDRQGVLGLICTSLGVLNVEKVWEKLHLLL